MRTCWSLYGAFLLLLISSTFTSTAVSCELTMGYRTNERPPLIGTSPNNNGLYKHLYTEAATRSGCELKIIRAPKNRILKLLQDGDIDFYPGFNFNLERANYTFFIENGLPGGDVGISLNSFPLVSHIKELNGATLLQALGSPNFVENIEGVHVYAVPEMTIHKAIELLRKRRGDFYIYNRSSISYYLKQHQHQDIKIHPDCCGGILPLYLGFSRNSRHYGEETNPDFDASKEKSVANFPFRLSVDSKAYQFQKTLELMGTTGETMSIYQRYH